MKSIQKIILDTDPGIDDALAILLALASPEIQLEGMTVVHGNCSVEQGTANALSILELAGASGIPVHAGYERPLVNPPLIAPETHGPSGLGYAELPAAQSSPEPNHAVEYLIDRFRQAPGEISLVTIGPLTNLAGAIRLEPELASWIKELKIMGGAILHGGNTTPLAEYNIFADPHAAHIVFHSGIPITLVPLDVTYQCLLTAADVGRIHPRSHPIAEFISTATQFYMEFHDSYQKIQGCIINDPLALSLVFQPDLCSYQKLFVDVDLGPGKASGNTYADFFDMEGNPPNMAVALEVRARDFIDLFINRINKLIKEKGGALD